MLSMELYMNDNLIEYPDRIKQTCNFTGLVYGKITPTDIDGCIEYKNKAYVFIEVKTGAKEPPFGQKLALERLVRDTAGKNKTSVAIIVEHDKLDCKDDIMVADCLVRSFYLSSDLI